MKVLAVSDTHIEAGLEHRRDPIADTDAMFAQVANLAVERGVSLVVHAGDVFHRAKPSPAALLCFKRFCDRLAIAEIPMVVIEGNGIHSAAPGQRSALELFESRWVRTSRRPEIISDRWAGASICTLPAATVGQLVARRNGGSREVAYEEAAELLVRAAADLFAEAPDDRPRILLAHQMVSGASLPTGLPVEQVGSLVLPLVALEAIGYDAIVLGDIHKNQLLGETTWYCGSPMCHDFGEAEVDHGVWLFDTDEPPIADHALEFCELQDRRFLTVDVDLTDSPGKGAASQTQEEGPRPPTPGEARRVEEAPGMRAPNPEPPSEWFADPFGPPEPLRISPEGHVPGIFASYPPDETDHIAAAIAENFPLTDAVVRVRVRAREDQWRRVDQRALERLIADAGAHRLYGGIQADLQREQQARAAGLSEALGPAAALAMWCEAQEVPAEQAEALAGLLGEWAE